jgi:hypothetical protein
MDGEAHAGVVAFKPQQLGRELVMLGQVQVGEIVPIEAGRYSASYCLHLPQCPTRWRPAADAETARRLVLAHVNDWLNAAGLTPLGVMPTATGATPSSSPARAARKDGTT